MQFIVSNVFFCSLSKALCLSICSVTWSGGAGWPEITSLNMKKEFKSLIYCAFVTPHLVTNSSQHSLENGRDDAVNQRLFLFCDGNYCLTHWDSVTDICVIEFGHHLFGQLLNTRSLLCQRESASIVVPWSIGECECLPRRTLVSPTHD